MSALAILAALPLLASVVLPGDIEVRRSSLFGYTLAGAGTYDLDEAAEHAEKASGLSCAITEAVANDTAEPPAHPGEDFDGCEPACSGPCEDGRPCLACVEALEADTDALMVELGYGEWNLTDDAPPVLEDDPAPLPPPPEPVPAPPPLPEAVARLCPACDGGRRRRCARCDGRCVRLWVDNREITRRGPTTEPGKLAGACALSALLPDILGNALAVKGAHELFSVCLTGCAPMTRELALMRWTLALA